MQEAVLRRIRTSSHASRTDLLKGQISRETIAKEFRALGFRCGHRACTSWV